MVGPPATRGPGDTGQLNRLAAATRASKEGIDLRGKFPAWRGTTSSPHYRETIGRLSANAAIRSPAAPMNVGSTYSTEVVMARAAAKTRAIAVPAPTPLWPHQAKSVAFFKAHERGFDNSDPGTGKTRVQIEVYKQRRKPRGRWLIICPKTLMIPAWGEDIEKYAPELTVAFATAENREAAFLAKTDVVVLNTDGIKWLAEKANQKLLKDFDHLTIDEYTAYKHPSSARTKAMVAARKFFTHRYALSGTPNPNTVMELFVPALIVDDGKRLGTSFTRFRNIVQVPEQVGPSPNHLKWADKPGAAQAMNELLGDITIRHSFADVMRHVPANHREVKAFDLSRRMRAIYKQMEAECLIAFDGEAKINAVHAASLRSKLLQIASGAVYDSEGNYKLVDTYRYELTCDLIEEATHSVVFFNWKHQRDYLSKELDKRDISFAVIDGSTPQRMRDDIVKRYQDGEYRTILLHPRTGAHGLTLTRGDTTIFTSPIYEADLMKQGIARIHRGSQNKVTRTVFLEAKNTVEQKVYARLEEKNNAMNDLLTMQEERGKRCSSGQT